MDDHEASFHVPAIPQHLMGWLNKLYLDCLVVKVRQHSNVINKSVYLALAINMDGQKEEEYIPQGHVDCSDRRCEILVVRDD